MFSRLNKAYLFIREFWFPILIIGSYISWFIFGDMPGTYPKVPSYCSHSWPREETMAGVSVANIITRSYCTSRLDDQINVATTSPVPYTELCLEPTLPTRRFPNTVEISRVHSYCTCAADEQYDDDGYSALPLAELCLSFQPAPQSSPRRSSWDTRDLTDDIRALEVRRVELNPLSFDSLYPVGVESWFPAMRKEWVADQIMFHFRRHLYCYVLHFLFALLLAIKYRALASNTSPPVHSQVIHHKHPDGPTSGQDNENNQGDSVNFAGTTERDGQKETATAAGVHLECEEAIPTVSASDCLGQYGYSGYASCKRESKLVLGQDKESGLLKVHPDTHSFSALSESNDTVSSSQGSSFRMARSATNAGHSTSVNKTAHDCLVENSHLGNDMQNGSLQSHDSETSTLSPSTVPQSSCSKLTHCTCSGNSGTLFQNVERVSWDLNFPNTVAKPTPRAAAPPTRRSKNIGSQHLSERHRRRQREKVEGGLVKGETEKVHWEREEEKMMTLQMKDARRTKSLGHEE